MSTFADQAGFKWRDDLIEHHRLEIKDLIRQLADSRASNEEYALEKSSEHITFTLLTEANETLNRALDAARAELAAWRADSGRSSKAAMEAATMWGIRERERDEARAELKALVGVMKIIGRTHYYGPAYNRAKTMLAEWEKEG